MNVSMYKSDGQTFEVSDDRLEDFLEQYPNATKVEEEAPDLSRKVEMYYVKDGDKYTPYEVSGDRLEDFKEQYPEARTAQGWQDYAKKQKEEIEAYNKKQADDAKERDLKQQKLKEENALLVKEHDTLGDRSYHCLLYTSPSPRDVEESRMPSSA